MTSSPEVEATNLTEVHEVSDPMETEVEKVTEKTTELRETITIADDQVNGDAMEEEEDKEETDPKEQEDESQGEQENKEAKNNQGEEAGEDEEEEVYIVERIVKHRKKGSRVQYFLKWKGYPDSENTWEDESNVFAQDLIDDYWQNANQSKSTPGRPTKTTPKTSATKTKTPKSEPVNKKRKIQEDDDLQQQLIDSEDWEEQVDEVETVERNANGELMIYLNWKSGHKTIHLAEIVNRKCPQKIIKFYESHLRFKTVS